MEKPLVLTRMFPPCWLAFTVREGSCRMQGVKGNKQAHSAVNPVSDKNVRHDKIQHGQEWHGGLTGMISCIWLDLRSAPQEETHAWYCKPGQEPIFEELTGHKHDPAAVILLSECSNKLVSKWIFLCSRVNGAFRPPQRSFFVLWLAVRT